MGKKANDSHLKTMLAARAEKKKIAYSWPISLPSATTKSLLELLDGWDVKFGRAPENSPNKNLKPRQGIIDGLTRLIVGASVPAPMADEIKTIAESQAGRKRNFICAWAVEAALKTATPEKVFEFFGAEQEPNLSLVLVFCLESGLPNYKAEFCSPQVQAKPGKTVRKLKQALEPVAG